MNRAALQLQVNMCARALNANLEGFTDEDALVQPPGGGNCANWIFGHIIASRSATLKLVKQSGVWSDDLNNRYKRGSDPLESGGDAVSLKKLRGDFATSQEKLMQGLESLSEEDLNEVLEPAFGSKATSRIEQLAFLQFHESYHVGQIGLLRRIVGKPGAIR